MFITPIHHPLRATVRVPGSKSLTNRALIIAALAPGRTILRGALFSDDSKWMAESLRRMGTDRIDLRHIVTHDFRAEN